MSQRAVPSPSKILITATFAAYDGNFSDLPSFDYSMSLVVA